MLLAPHGDPQVQSVAVVRKALPCIFSLNGLKDDF